jgi:hypothetical protein
MIVLIVLIERWMNRRKARRRAEGSSQTRG